MRCVVKAAYLLIRNNLPIEIERFVTQPPARRAKPPAPRSSSVLRPASIVLPERLGEPNCRAPREPDRMRPHLRLTAATLLAVAALVGCSASRQTSQTLPQPSAVKIHGDSAAIANAKGDKDRYAYTEADVQFLTGMISHHAQAIVMSKLAPTNGASSSIQTLAARIIN